MRKPIMPIMAALALAGCMGADLRGIPGLSPETTPPQAEPGRCYARGTSRGTPDDVAIGRPQPSMTIWFETPCALQSGDPGFIKDVQRALQARDLYDGPIHGRYDAATRTAVLRLQDPRGLASSTLSSETATYLGLIALGRDG
ncbi:MAG: peptidoglycan-binding domain-containing protein [Pseudomonadota bacterium]